MTTEGRAVAQDLVAAVRSIAHGGVAGPTGLEAVAMALAGDSSYTSMPSVAGNLLCVSLSLDQVAEGLNAIAAAISSLAPKTQSE